MPNTTPDDPSNNPGDELFQQPPAPASDEEIEQQLTALNEHVNANPELAGNETVATALDNVNKQPRSSFSQSAGVITALNQAIPKFTDPNSNAEDIASGSLQLASSILYAASAIPGVVVITAPLGFLVGLVGAIVGIFGSKKQNMLDQIKVVVNDAVDRANSEQMQQDLAGAYRNILDRYITLSTILSSNSSIGPASAFYNQYSLDEFTAIASDEIGAAIKNLDLNADIAKKDNWDNSANTYFALSQVLMIKAMYISQGIAFFNIREDSAAGGLASESSILAKAAVGIFKSYANDAGKFICRPSIIQAGITHSVFRLPETRYRIIGVVFSQLGLIFWPYDGSQYRFTDTVSSAKQGNSCARLSVLNAFTSSPEMALGNDFKFSASDVTGEKTHFMLWADPDSNYDTFYNPPPRYRWFLQPSVNSHNLGYRECYIFRVNPTAQERQDYKLKDFNGSLVMIGDVDKDAVWHMKTKDKSVDKSKYGDIVNPKGDSVGWSCWMLLAELQ